MFASDCCIHEALRLLCLDRSGRPKRKCSNDTRVLKAVKAASIPKTKRPKLSDGRFPLIAEQLVHSGAVSTSESEVEDETVEDDPIQSFPFVCETCGAGFTNPQVIQASSSLLKS